MILKNCLSPRNSPKSRCSTTTWVLQQVFYYSTRVLISSFGNLLKCSTISICSTIWDTRVHSGMPSPSKFSCVSLWTVLRVILKDISCRKILLDFCTRNISHVMQSINWWLTWISAGCLLINCIYFMIMFFNVVSLTLCLYFVIYCQVSVYLMYKSIMCGHILANSIVLCYKSINYYHHSITTRVPFYQTEWAWLRIKWKSFFCPLFCL